MSVYLVTSNYSFSIFFRFFGVLETKKADSGIHLIVWCSRYILFLHHLLHALSSFIISDGDKVNACGQTSKVHCNSIAFTC